MDFVNFPVRDWSWGGNVLYLYLYCNKTWTDAAGVTHLKSAEGSGQPYQICPGIVNGRNAVISTFAFAPTLNALDGNDVRISGVLVDNNLLEREPLFKNKVFPTTPDPLTYPEFLTYNKSLHKRLGARYGTIEDFMALLATITGSVLPASDVVLGSVVTDVTPADPLLPRVVGVKESGMGVLVAEEGAVIVPDDPSLIAESSPIQAVGADAGITGYLYATDRLEGESFRVVSSNGADTGAFKWFLY